MGEEIWSGYRHQDVSEEMNVGSVIFSFLVYCTESDSKIVLGDSRCQSLQGHHRETFAQYVKQPIAHAVPEFSFGKSFQEWIVCFHYLDSVSFIVKV